MHFCKELVTVDLQAASAYVAETDAMDTVEHVYSKSDLMNTQCYRIRRQIVTMHILSSASWH
jgi:hypothetical protein